jgi:membrane protein required for colicin V production
MNGFDVALLVLLGVLVVVGLLKGLVRILIGLLAVVAAFFVASHGHRPLAERMGTIDLSPEVLQLIAYLALFVVVLLAGGVLAWLLRKILRAAMLGWVDRLAGAALGVAVAMLATALVVLPAVAYVPGGASWLDGSRLAPYVTAVADLAVRTAPDDLADAYRRGMESLRRVWGGYGQDATNRATRGVVSARS